LAVKLDGTLNAIILDATSTGALTIKTGVNPAPWTWTFPTTPGTAGQVLATDGTGTLSWVTGGGGGTPAGSTTQVQFNNAGAFGADANFTFSPGPNRLTLGTGGGIALANPTNTFTTNIVAGASTASWTLTLPATAGTSGQVLTTDGTGSTTWSASAGGATVVNDTTTATAEYPLFAAITTGTLTTAYTASPDYTYTPAAGELTAPHTVSSTGIGLNSNFIAASYVIPAGTNGISAGTLTFAAGATVTAPPGTNWVVV